MATADKLIQALFEAGQIQLGDRQILAPIEEEEEAFAVDYRALVSGTFAPLADSEFGFTDEEFGLTPDELGMFVGMGPERVPESVSCQANENGLFEYCAWYQPIHYFGYDWGIFVREECLRSIGQTIACFLPHRYPWRQHPQLGRQLVLAAFFLLFLHEHFHHKVESFGIRLWVVEKTGRYTAYKSAVYRPTWLTDDNLEEALANADAVRRLVTAPYRRLLLPEVRLATGDAAKWLMQLSPGGYRRGIDYLDTKSFQDGVNTLEAQIQDASLTPSQTEGDWEFAPRMMQSFLNVSQRIWTVIPRGTSSRLPLVHAAPVRTPSSQQLRRHLISEGFSEKTRSGKGSHTKFKKQGFAPIIVPANRERVSPGVARNIAHALDMENISELNATIE